MPIFSVQKASGAVGDALDRLRIALSASSVPVEGARSSTGVTMTKPYAELLLLLPAGQLRNRFNADWCQIPTGGFADDASRMKWSRENPWCPIPQNSTVRGAVAGPAANPPMDGSAFLAAMGMTCDSWSLLGTDAARAAAIRLSPSLKESLGVSEIPIDSVVKIQAAIDDQCKTSGMPVFRTEAERSEWKDAHPGISAPGVVPCPPAPVFDNQLERDLWVMRNVGCTATYTTPPIAPADHTILYVVLGGIGVAGLAWWMMNGRKAKK